MDKKLLIIFIIVVLVVAAGAYWLGLQKGLGLGYGKGKAAGYEEGKEVGRAAAQTEASQAVTNPLEELPSTNPFEEVVNPFEAAYKNPFK